MATQEKINCFYLGTETIDYSIEIKRPDDGILVNCSEHSLEEEFFPVSGAKQFIEDYGDEYLNVIWEEGKNYEIV